MLNEWQGRSRGGKTEEAKGGLKKGSPQWGPEGEAFGLYFD